MSYRKLFIAFNVALVVGFALSFLVDYQAEWKVYQKKFYQLAAADLEAKAAKAPAEEAKGLREEAAKLRSTPLEIKQIIARDLGKIDRCTTCHVGMDEYVNPTMKNGLKDNPYKSHPNIAVLNAKHPFQKFGCTVCHQGQGLATTVAAAHGKVRNWEKPMLEGPMIQASCARCHEDFQHLKGAEFAAKGDKLFHEHGCQGCHSIRGVGGVVSVDLRDIADKPLERIAGFNFSQVKKDGKPLPEDEWTIPNWILGHLTNDPLSVTPNDPHAKFNPEPVAPNGMPNFTENDASGKRELSVDDAHAITTYLLSMTEEPIPHQYFVSAGADPEPRFSDPAMHGKFVFEKYGCAGCHGLHGTKGRRNFNALGAGQKDPENDMDKGREPTLVDTVGTYTHDELIKKISTGVPASAVNKYNPSGPTTPLYMPSWKDKISKKEIDDVATWLLTIAKKQDVGF
jgi:cytochrome c2